MDDVTMPRETEVGVLRRKHKLGNDAHVILTLHKHQPLSFASLVEKAGVREVRLRYDILPYLIQRGIVRELKHGSEKVYVLGDYDDLELAVTDCILDFQLLHQRWPSLDEIASRVGIPPGGIRHITYKIAPTIGWET